MLMESNTSLLFSFNKVANLNAVAYNQHIIREYQACYVTFELNPNKILEIKQIITFLLKKKL